MASERVVTIHNGINTDKFHRRQSREAARVALGLPNRSLIVGGLGRLDEAKGFTYLIEAASQLLPEFPDLLIAIAGEGRLRTQLEAEAYRLGVAERVRFLGFQSDVQLLLDSLDLFALPSLCEALPYALLEAMATELPVVGSAVGGVPEVIVPDITGFVVPARDANRLAESLRILLRDREMRIRMGTMARERVIRLFQESEMVRKTLEVYRSFTPCRNSINRQGMR
jgi:glycosyltransferase involved in cell wall biosynthesis